MFGGLITYCLKGNSPRLKLTLGFLYAYWINHFFTLGAYCGIINHLPCNWIGNNKGAMKKVTIPTEYQLG